MAAPRKYPDELRERAVRLAVDARKNPATRPGALARIGGQLGINPETLRPVCAGRESRGRTAARG
jgi:transposase-like protein